MEEHIFDELGELLTTAEAAAALGTSERSLENWRMAGTGPRYTRVGGQVRYPFKWMRQYLIDNAVETQNRGGE